MKIGIITQPLATNYGGILQNYALQKALIRLGHEVYTINRNNLPEEYISRWDKRLIFHTKQKIKKFLRKPYRPSMAELLEIRKHCISFVKNNISTTGTFKNREELQEIINDYKFDGYIVGSDQVWRPMYSLNIYNDFLDFCQEEQGVKRIAYAASFGVKEWEFNEEESEECSRLAKLFNAISVREDSGIALCKEHLYVDATHVLDPTMLLDKENYIELAESAGETPSEGNLFCYILDNTKEIQNAVSYIEEELSLTNFNVRAQKGGYTIKCGDDIGNYTIPSPTKWLRAFMDAKMVFTDSFHGCVFSIIFNKPFWVIGNEGRGNARFDSLLKLFNLENRKIGLKDIKNTDLTAPIDWNEVNTTRKEWQDISLNFIKRNL